MAAPTAPGTGGLLAGGGRGGDVADADLVTPEAVVLGLPLASVGSRGVSLLIDLVIQVTALVLLTFGAAAVELTSGGWVGVVVLLLAVFAILFVYPVSLETFLQGRTVGKLVMGLRVVTVEAGPVGFRHAAIRAALGLVDFWATSGGVGVIAALLTRRAQRLGDLAAGTVVIREGRGRRGVTAMRFTPPPGAEEYAARLDVSALGDDDYQAVRSVLARAASLPPATAEHLAGAAAAKVVPRTAPTPPAGMPPTVVLTCLAAAYQQRHRGRAASAVSDWIWSREGTPPSQ